MSEDLRKAAADPANAEIFDNASEGPYTKSKPLNPRSAKVPANAGFKKGYKRLATEAGSSAFDPEFTRSLANNMPADVASDIKKKLS